VRKPYIYRLRPGYGSDKLLLEFMLADLGAEFINDLLIALHAISPVVDSVEELWLNDEVLMRVSSTQGAFLLAKNTWGFAFLTAEENQSCLKCITDILNDSSLFEREEVDFEKYNNLAI